MDINKIIGGLSILKVPFMNDSEVQEILDSAIDLLKDQQEQIEQMNYIYGFVYGGQVKEIKKLVRCNECKHRDPEDHKCDCGHDILWQLPRSDNWFCADGERRTDNGQ